MNAAANHSVTLCLSHTHKHTQKNKIISGEQIFFFIYKDILLSKFALREKKKNIERAHFEITLD